MIPEALFVLMASSQANIPEATLISSFEQLSSSRDFKAFASKGIPSFLEVRTDANGKMDLAEVSADVVGQRAVGCVSSSPDKFPALKTPIGDIVSRVRFSCEAKPSVDPCVHNLAAISLMRADGIHVAMLVPRNDDQLWKCPASYQRVERLTESARLKTGELTLDAFLQEVRLGRNMEAANRIAEVQTLSGMAPQFADGASYVARVQSCEAVGSEKIAIGYRLSWKCPDGDFLQVVDTSYRRPKLLVTELMRKGYVSKVAPPKAVKGGK